MSQWKRFIIVIVVAVMVFAVSLPVCAEPRNLLTDYYSALKRMDAGRAALLLNEGLTVSDAVNAAFNAVHAKLSIPEGSNYSDTLGLMESSAGSAIAKGFSIASGMLTSSGSIIMKKASESEVKFFGSIFQDLRKHGANFTAASYYNDLFSPEMPTNMFRAIVIGTNKKVFTGSEIANFLNHYWSGVSGEKIVRDTALNKLNVLIQCGARIDRDSNSDGLVSKFLDNLLPGSVGNFAGNHLSQGDVNYFKQVCGLLKKLNVNPGPKERSFWQVMSTKTPWEVLNDYREKHRNEPSILKFCNQIENILSTL